LENAGVQPDKIALEVVGAVAPEQWTYGALYAAVAGFARHLQDEGVRPGDRVLMRLGNTPDFPIVFLGAILAGAVPIPTSSQLTQAEVTKIAAQTKPRLVVAGRDIALPEGDGPVLSQKDLAQTYAKSAPSIDMGDPNRPAYIIYTSGTSGVPRAVEHAHRAIWARRMMWEGWYGLRPDDVMLHAGAFNWTYTLGTGLMDPWAIGASALIPAEGTDPRDLPRLIAQHQATIFAAAPGVYRRMFDLHLNLSGPPKHRARLAAAGPRGCAT